MSERKAIPFDRSRAVCASNVLAIDDGYYPEEFPLARHVPMRMPDLLVYGRVAIYGLLVAESGRLAFLGSAVFGNWVAN